MHIFTKVYKKFHNKQLHIIIFNIFKVKGKILFGFGLWASNTEFLYTFQQLSFLKKLDIFSKGYQDIDDNPKE